MEMNMKSNLAHEQQRTQVIQEHSIFNCDLCRNEISFAPHPFGVNEKKLCLDCVRQIAFGYLNHIDQIFQSDYTCKTHEAQLEYRDSLSPIQYTKKKIGQRLRMQVYERDGFACVTCGVQKNLSLDHIKPEVLGGESTLENLQTMCTSCNSSKGARYVETPDQ